MMNHKTFSKTYTVRWADLDANIHMRHSAYNDYAAQTRFMFLASEGFDIEWYREHRVSPILFREEIVFKKEVKGGEEIRVDVQLQQVSEDGSRWTMVSHIFRQDGLLAATITVDGAWLNHETRKLSVPPDSLRKHVESLMHAENFTEIKAAKS